MPQLTQRKTKKLVLPKSTKIYNEECWVECYETAVMGDFVGVSAITDQIESSLAVLAKIIKNWNFTAEDGSTLSINSVNVGLLPLEDIVFLSSELGVEANLIDNAKKNSLSISSE